MPRRATLERIASTIRWAFSPLSSRVFVAATARTLGRWLAGQPGDLAELHRRVVAGDHHGRIEGADALPLLQQLIPLGAEVLREVHPLEVLREGPNAVGGDHDEAFVGVDQQGDQSLAMPGSADPAQARLDLS